MRRCLLPLFVTAACQPDVPGIKPVDSDPPVPIDTDVPAALDVPDIEVTPSELRFPSLPLECVTDPKQVTITNVGTADLTLDLIEIKGAGINAFTVSTPRNPVLAPGDSRTLDVEFVARQYAVYDPKLVIESDDPDEGTVRVSLFGEGSQAAFNEDFFTQDQSSNVDVLFTIDASGSMGDEIDNLKTTFDQFIASFTNLGLNYRIAAVSADGSTSGCAQIDDWIDSSSLDPVTEFGDMADAIFASGCGAEEGFRATKTALASRPDFLRADAGFAAITVSDEPEQSGISPADFVTWLDGLKPDAGDTSFSAFTGPKTGASIINACPRGSHPNAEAEAAPQYHNAIRLSGGVWGDLCSFDIAPFLQHASYVAAGLNVAFPLSSTPTSTSPSAVTVTVDGQEVPFDVLDGWTYDAETNSIVFHGASIPDPGAAIVIRFPYDPGC